MSETIEADFETTQLPAVREEPANNPMSLLAQAVANGMDAGQLKSLVDLQEQYRAARAKEAFAVAMNAVQSQMPCIVRDAENSQTNSRYVRLETITHQAKHIYSAHGFSLSFSEEDCPIEKFKRIVCHVRHNDGHTEKHWIDLPLDGFSSKGNPIGAMNPVQAAISTGSYGQRVLICRVFNITIANTDLDGNPPAYENPSESRTHSKPAPRGQRQPEKLLEVTKEQCAFALAHWRADHPQADADVAAWNKKFHTYVNWAAKRDFDASKAQNWTRADFVKVCEAVGCNPEDAPGWEVKDA